MLNLIAQYTQELDKLEQAKEAVPEEILQVLLVRDRIQKILSDNTDISADMLSKLFKLDSRLKKQANKINQIEEIGEWRNNLEIPITSWWWFLPPENHHLDQYDWLWNSLTVGSLTLSLSLVVDISNRFLSGGVGFSSALATILPSVLTLFTAGGVLTGAGKTAIENLLLKLRIPTYFLAEAKLVMSATLLFGLIGFKAYIPQIAQQIANDKQGLENYKNYNWDQAISNYEKAINLDPDNAQAHRQLGLIYEQLQDLEKAKIEYKLAAKGNLPIAYSNLARLYLLEKKPTEAVSLLYVLWNFQPKVNEKPQTQDNILRYNLYKNFGWARFQQNRYEEAKEELEKAITFHEKLTDSEKDGAAYCLLAQVLEKLEDEKKNKVHLQKYQEHWELCISNGNPRFPEVDEWKFTANQRLSEGEK
ncbi:MAG: hypothetical protein RLZZ507_811 [Cyanobacteriota bacterium]